ncbi:MAG: GGDEF domain-containing protein [Gammaproteobacteria bacterium]|nr:GGDEF domain-containing protein [Gammaproteobacteria bacterium]
MLVLIIATEAAFILYVKGGGGVSLPAHMVAAVHTCSSILVVHLIGLPATYWLYPVLLSNFYLLPLSSAVLINVAATIAAPLLIIEHSDLVFRLASTLTIMNALGFVFSMQVSKQHRELDHLSLIDPLTLAGNRRALNDKIKNVAQLKMRHDWHVSAIMLDIDNFKQINDQFDHQTGDLVLIAMVDLIKDRLRQTDTIYRYGGEEFVILTLHTNLKEALYLADMLRQKAMSLSVGSVGEISFSAGVAELRSEESAESWIRRADRALMEAKQSGKNRVCVDQLAVELV